MPAQRRPRPRKLFKSLLFVLALLVGGAIINVAVAWGCVGWLWEPGRMHRMRDAFSRVSSIEALRISREDSGGATLVFVTVMAGHHLANFSDEHFHGDTRKLAPGWIELDPPFPGFRESVKRMGSESINGDAIFLGAGWPVRGCWCQLARGLVSGNDLLLSEMADGGIPIGRQGTVDAAFRVLPLRPIWPGFAINTIFYAVILYALFAVPGPVRRRLRTKRGQCAACGYSLRENTSDKCPECGTAAQRAN